MCDCYFHSLPPCYYKLFSNEHFDRAALYYTLSSYPRNFSKFWGGLSDCIGRKKIFLSCLGLNCFIVILIILSKHIEIFLFLRCLQGVVLAGPLMISKAILIDSFSGKKLNKYLSYFLMGSALGFLVTPFIGGYLQYFFGWHGSFYFMGIFTLMLFSLVLFCFKETFLNITKYSNEIILYKIKKMCSCPSFVINMILSGLTYSFLIVFYMFGPFFIQKHLGYNSIVYGFAVLFLGVAWLIGYFIYRLLLFKNDTQKLFLIAALFACFIGFIMLVISFWQWVSLALIITLLALIFVCGAFMFADRYCAAISRFPNSGGLGGSLIGAFCLIIAGVFSGVVYFFKTYSLFSLTLIYLILIALTMGLYYAFFHREKRERG